MARYSIGIDLGTTNSAMACAPLHGDAASEVFAVSQWDTPTALTEAATLPSFLYRPEDAVAAQMLGRDDGDAAWIVGRLARRRAGEVPGRVAHSAKSWLCHHAADRSARFLPWASRDIPNDAKISPIRASALILNYLRGAWNNRFAAAGPDFAFDAQEITVTVPASFDAAAQRLTLDAAREAGFPAGVRLLEEPQAALYRWLEQHHPERDLWSRLPARDAGTWHVVVIDIGGGTSDFSLFEIRRTGAGAEPALKRVAVSDHLLLGGDNIDLALAHMAEARLAGEDGSLSAGQWDHLVARCRDLKETALSRDGEPDEAFAVSIPGRGASLMAGALSTHVTRGALDALLLDGFFPECPADARPTGQQAALKEWGLPFARDGAITRHLAAFLHGRPAVDAVLFNGGTLYPETLRSRLRRQIGAWQGGPEPVVLDNAEPDLAVARGAARFGKLVHERAARIEAGAARAVFLEAHGRRGDDGEAGEPSLLCILPRGAAPEETYHIAEPGLALRVNRPVRFQPHASTRHGRVKAGERLPADAADMHPLPPLETVATVAGATSGKNVEGEVPGDTIPVTLSAKLNELGLLTVACVSADPDLPQTWPLEFNLRPVERGAPATVAKLDANADPKALEAARQRLEEVLSRPPGKRDSKRDKKDKLTATRLLKTLEGLLGRPRGEWNWVLVRSLWPALEATLPCRRLSVEHEETWLILAGFLLRPGFGAPLDDARMDALWRLREAGLSFPGKRIALQEHILWRRVAGGLDRARQDRILKPHLDRLRGPGDAPPELVRLAGALERIAPEGKTALVDAFIARGADLAREHKHCAPYLAALGLLLNRAPLYAGPETVVPPDLVERAFQAFAALDWTHPELIELQPLFLRAARVVDNRTLDLPRGLRSKIAGKLEKSGVSAQRTARVRDYLPLEQSDRAGLYGEALPPGLVLE